MAGRDAIAIQLATEKDREITCAGQTFRPDFAKAYFEFRMSQAFPVGLGWWAGALHEGHVHEI